MSNSTDYGYDIETLEEDTIDHGETHVTVEEIDGEVELRRGPTEFDYDAGVIRVYDGTGFQVFGMDRVVHHYKPHAVFHGEGD